MLYFSAARTDADVVPISIHSKTCQRNGVLMYRKNDEAIHPVIAGGNVPT